MKVGLLARAEDRGLGNMTREWYRHIKPDRTLIMRPPHDLPLHREWYAEEAQWCTLGTRREVLDRDAPAVWDFLDGLDVLYSAETFYDWRIVQRAHELGVRTVCHVMPEYWAHERNPRLARPDVLWIPSGWRRETVPGARPVLVPVATDRFETIHDSRFAHREGKPLRWLHVAGAPANGDRNGTRILGEALQHLRERHVVTVCSQYEPTIRRLARGRRGPRTRVEVVGEVADYWSMYADQDAMVFPRRYGGLSLPAHEAMAAGLALVMPDVAPQHDEWPIVPVAATAGAAVQTTAGAIPTTTTDARALAATMDTLAADPAALAEAQRAARAWADLHAWKRRADDVRLALTLALE